MGYVSTLLINSPEKPFIHRRIVHDDGFTARNAGTNEAVGQPDSNLTLAVRHCRIELASFGIDNPDAAALSADEIAAHVRVQLQEGAGVLRLAYSRGVAEDHS